MPPPLPSSNSPSDPPASVSSAATGSAFPVPPPFPTPNAPDVEKPPQLTKAPPTDRKFPCRQCGAKLNFDPAIRGLKCPYCGFAEIIADEPTTISEHSLDSYLSNAEQAAEASQSTLAGRSSQVKCTGCGAVVLLEDHVATDDCPYCGTHLQNKPESAEHCIPPESVLPFSIPDRQARDAFVTWTQSLWFAPNEFKRLANLGQLQGVYLPYWTYDAMTYTTYRGMRGDDYTTTEYVTDADGKRRSERVTRTNWYNVSGEIQHFFDDVLVPATQSVTHKLLYQLPPWDLEKLTPFRDEFLSGLKTERYAIPLKEGWDKAQEIMQAAIRQLCLKDIGGDHQRINSSQTKNVGVTYKHTLLPVWLAPYRYRERVFQILVNGRTGKVVGNRPYSFWKIFSLTMSILTVAGGLLYLYLRNKP